VEHSFTGGADGSYPYASLIFDKAGNLYGSTVSGGNPGCTGGYGCGVVFKIAPDGTETTLYAFNGGTDGSDAGGGVVADAKGNLYGTTIFGGIYGAGVVFKLTPPPGAGVTWTETVLHTFAWSDGGNPGNALLLKGSNLYGTAGAGGSGNGVVFRLTTKGIGTTLDFFTGGADGALPQSNLIADAAGNLYGTASYGGAVDCINGLGNPSGCGVVFKLAPPAIAGGPWVEIPLHAFTGIDGSAPFSGVIADGKGNLYGTTTGYESSGYGTVFKLAPDGTIATLHAFTNGADGGRPAGNLLLKGKTLYGTAQQGGTKGWGVVFKIVQ
jgi:uncharacterized repeat protein (TIGR03803 family)